MTLQDDWHPCLITGLAISKYGEQELNNKANVLLCGAVPSLSHSLSLSLSLSLCFQIDIQFQGTNFVVIQYNTPIKQEGLP